MDYFYNAHVHVFTFKNVPDRFARSFAWGLGGLISITKARKSAIYRAFLNNILRFTNNGLIKFLLKKYGVDEVDFAALNRIVNFVKFGEGFGKDKLELSQEHIFNNLQGYYPKNTKFIALSMDMEYMGAGEVPEKYDVQTKELEEIKKKYPETFYPFVFADPRRIEKKAVFFNNENNFLEYFKKKISDGTFAGIKMYPALGYFPFDKRLEEVYDFALEKSVPIMAHCSGGPVYYRKKIEINRHPIDNNIVLHGKKPKDFTPYFSNPINYHMLLCPDIITKYWKKEKDYRRLKICLGHFGGDLEWMKYLQNPWVSSTGSISDPNEFPALKRENWNFNKDFESGKYTWFSVICDLLERYENLYADISSSLEEERIFPLLKMLLEPDSGNKTNSKYKISDKILFGTDFYMVSMDKSERELSIGLRSYLGEKLFEKIAVTNVNRYLFDK